MKKETLVQLIIIMVLTMILAGLVFVTSKEMNSRDNKMFGMNPMEEEVEKDTKKVNAKSIMGIMSLAISKGTKVGLSADGSDAEEAVEAPAAE